MAVQKSLGCWGSERQAIFALRIAGEMTVRRAYQCQGERAPPLRPPASEQKTGGPTKSHLAGERTTRGYSWRWKGSGNILRIYPFTVGGKKGSMRHQYLSFWLAQATLLLRPCSSWYIRLDSSSNSTTLAHACLAAQTTFPNNLTAYYTFKDQWMGW